jgi:hypothetical protein
VNEREFVGLEVVRMADGEVMRRMNWDPPLRADLAERLERGVNRNLDRGTYITRLVVKP